MADLTSTQIDTLISNAYNALNSALASPKPNYQIGSRRVDHGTYVTQLMEVLKDLRKMKAAGVSEAVYDFDYEITKGGTDNTEYEGDEDLI